MYNEQNLKPNEKLYARKGPKGIDYDMDMNSSIMIWRGNCTWAWSFFYENLDYYMIKYNGIDSYLYFNHWEKLNWIPRGEVYSRPYGIDEEKNWGFDKFQPEKLGDIYFYDSNYKVCIVNGWKRKKYEDRSSGHFLIGDDAYHGLEHYWD